VHLSPGVVHQARITKDQVEIPNHDQEKLQPKAKILVAIVVTWSLVYGLDFLLGLWLFVLGVLDLEKGTLPWLAIGLFLELFYLSRLSFSGVAFVPMVE